MTLRRTADNRANRKNNITTLDAFFFFVVVVFFIHWKISTTQSYIKSVTKIGRGKSLHVYADNIHSYQLHTDM